MPTAYETERQEHAEYERLALTEYRDYQSKLQEISDLVIDYLGEDELNEAQYEALNRKILELVGRTDVLLKKRQESDPTDFNGTLARLDFFRSQLKSKLMTISQVPVRLNSGATFEFGMARQYEFVRQVLEFRQRQAIYDSTNDPQTLRELQRDALILEVEAIRTQSPQLIYVAKRLKEREVPNPNIDISLSNEEKAGFKILVGDNFLITNPVVFKTLWEKISGFNPIALDETQRETLRELRSRLLYHKDHIDMLVSAGLTDVEYFAQKGITGLTPEKFTEVLNATTQILERDAGTGTERPTVEAWKQFINNIRVEDGLNDSYLREYLAHLEQLDSTGFDRIAPDQLQAKLYALQQLSRTLREQEQFLRDNPSNPSSMTPADNAAVLAYIYSIRDEIGRYHAKIEAAINERLNPVVLAPEEKDYGAYNWVLESSPHKLIAMLVTGDIDRGDEAANRKNAYARRAEMLKNSPEWSDRQMAHLLEKTTTLFEFGIEKGDVLNFDTLAIQASAVKEGGKLYNVDCVKNIDRLRQTEFFIRAIQPLSQKIYETMFVSSDKSMGANKDWSDSTELIKYSHRELLASDPEYAQYFGLMGSAQSEAEQLVLFFGKYYSALRSSRNIAHDGKGRSRSSIKTALPQKPDETIIWSELLYNTTKNKFPLNGHGVGAGVFWDFSYDPARGYLASGYYERAGKPVLPGEPLLPTDVLRLQDGSSLAVRLPTKDQILNNNSSSVPLPVIGKHQGQIKGLNKVAKLADFVNKSLFEDGEILGQTKLIAGSEYQAPSIAHFVEAPLWPSRDPGNFDLTRKQNNFLESYLTEVDGVGKIYTTAIDTFRNRITLSTQLEVMQKELSEKIAEFTSGLGKAISYSWSTPFDFAHPNQYQAKIDELDVLINGATDLLSKEKYEALRLVFEVEKDKAQKYRAHKEFVDAYQEAFLHRCITLFVAGLYNSLHWQNRSAVQRVADKITFKEVHYLEELETLRSALIDSTDANTTLDAFNMKNLILDLADEHGKGGLLERRNFKTAGVVKITEINMDIEHKVKAGHHGWLKNFVRSVMNYSANRRKTPGDQIIMPFNQITKKENDK